MSKAMKVRGEGEDSARMTCPSCGSTFVLEPAAEPAPTEDAVGAMRVPRVLASPESEAHNRRDREKRSARDAEDEARSAQLEEDARNARAFRDAARRERKSKRGAVDYREAQDRVNNPSKYQERGR